MKNFLIFYLLLPTISFAAIEVGSARDLNCEVARSFAIKNALEKYAGQVFDYTKRESCKEKNNDISCTFEKSLDIDTAGTLKRIVEEKVTKDKECTVFVKIEIEKTRLYNVEVKGKQKYLSGEPIEYIFETKEPLYLYVFNVYRAGMDYEKATLMYPTDRLNNNLIDGKFVFPGTDKVKFTTYVAYGDVSKEKLIFLFTKHKLYDKKEWTNYEIDGIIKSIPTFSRRVVSHDIIIERRM